MMNKASMKDLLDKYLTETLTADEMLQFQQLLADQQLDQELESGLKALFDHQLTQEYHLPEVDQRIEQHVMSAIHNNIQRPRVRRLWLAAAAVILLLIATGIGYFTRISKPAPPMKVLAHTDIQPGVKGAVLTLADGQQVQLDSIHNGTIALQGGVAVKVKNGELSYAGGTNEVVYNTVSTPNGHQYRLTLPDGTRVWLNAGSSIHYSLLFSGHDRTVALTGEGFFEVAADATKPFIVTVNQKNLVEVLGTSFNIKAYQNEEKITATLLEGSIRVANNTLLKPGQQAIIQNSVRIVNDPDLEKVIAWKNNLFDFDDSDLTEVMHQIERWYDIEVVYAGQQPDIQFTGKISRNMTLQHLLTTLEVSGVKCRLEERKLVVFP
jgi:ferric-dicitrate binding protein FerR (iron transport regulator)